MRTDETHVLRLFDPSAVETMLGSAGFSFERLDDYGEVGFPSYVVGYAATLEDT